MKNPRFFLLTSFLLIILIFLRIWTRNQYPLWADEIEEISHLISFRHLIFEYLPTIPGALPGHYLLTLPLNYIASNNKFILGLPGLAAHLFVFFLIPYTISLLQIADKKNVPLIALITRIGFVLDPRLTYQSMEVRPYSVLPLLWVISVILCSHLFRLKDKQGNTINFIAHILILTFFTIIVFMWHFYGLIMVVTIYLFMLSQQSGNKIDLILKTKSIYPLILSTIICLPLWKYFTQGLSQYRHDTFEFIPIILKMIENQNNLVLFFSVLFLLYLFRNYLLNQINRILLNQSIRKQILAILFYMVFIPIFIIFILDLLQPYYFLYRQFSWVAIPLYMATGILINNLFFKKSYAQK